MYCKNKTSRTSKSFDSCTPPCRPSSTSSRVEGWQLLRDFRGRRVALIKQWTSLRCQTSDQGTTSRHNAFHSNGAYNDIVNSFMFFSAFDGRLAIEFMILQIEMGKQRLDGQKSSTHTFLTVDQSVTFPSSTRGTRVPSITSFTFPSTTVGDSSDEPILTTITSTLPLEMPYLRIASVIFRIYQHLQHILKPSTQLTLWLGLR